MQSINLRTAERAIAELLSLSQTLTSLGVKYETQKPLFSLAETIYAREVIPEVLANEPAEHTETFQ